MRKIIRPNLRKRGNDGSALLAILRARIALARISWDSDASRKRRNVRKGQNPSEPWRTWRPLREACLEVAFETYERLRTSISLACVTSCKTGWALAPTNEQDRLSPCPGVCAGEGHSSEQRAFGSRVSFLSVLPLKIASRPPLAPAIFLSCGISSSRRSARLYTVNRRAKPRVSPTASLGHTGCHRAHPCCLSVGE